MIRCSDYDYIEIVCLYRYPVRLTLKDGTEMEGIALDTRRDESRREAILLSIHQQERLVVLDEIKQLSVLVENPHFRDITLR
ncbi:Rho-binding antiterminator [Vibrio scophthalmi]|uniref:Rho-binding antiterminator n=1 Tax=Vibrio scophthalmi TaxID=45658 RepID=UPI002FF3E862